MEQLKGLFSKLSRGGNKKPKEHKDKLAATKAQEREVHEALKSRAQEQKERRQEVHALEKEADQYNTDVLHPDSKAAKKHAHKEAAREHKAERHAALAECSHGEKNCKICAPRHK